MATSKKSVAKYVQKTYDRVVVQVRKPGRDAIKAAASVSGQSVNAYVLQAVRERMEREGLDYNVIVMPNADDDEEIKEKLVEEEPEPAE